MTVSKKVKIGPKYQVVIPKEVRENLDIKPGTEVLVSSTDAHSLRVTINPNNWVEASYGCARGAWGRDSDKYLKRLRASWLKRKS